MVIRKIIVDVLTAADNQTFEAARVYGGLLIVTAIIAILALTGVEAWAVIHNKATLDMAAAGTGIAANLGGAGGLLAGMGAAAMMKRQSDRPADGC